MTSSFQKLRGFTVHAKTGGLRYWIFPPWVPFSKKCVFRIRVDSQPKQCNTCAFSQKSILVWTTPQSLLLWKRRCCVKNVQIRAVVNLEHLVIPNLNHWTTFGQEITALLYWSQAEYPAIKSFQWHRSWSYCIILLFNNDFSKEGKQMFLQKTESAKNKTKPKKVLINNTCCGHGLSFSLTSKWLLHMEHITPVSVTWTHTHTQSYTHIQCLHSSLFSTLCGCFKQLHCAERKDHSMSWGSDVLWALRCAHLLRVL